MQLSHLPLRLVTGAYIVHSALDKRGADDETASGLHGTASAAYPVVERLAPSRFVRLLSATELAVGTALLVPVVPSRLAGAALGAFSSALLGLYLRTPGMTRPGSVRPSPDGIAVSKDVWMLGIAAALMIDD